MFFSVVLQIRSFYADWIQFFLPVFVNRHRFDDDPGPDPTFCVDAGCIGQVNS
jgi:hypothetical protein